MRHSVIEWNGLLDKALSLRCSQKGQLVALGVKPGDRVAVPPLTYASTTLAVLHAGAVPVFVDVEPKTWNMDPGLSFQVRSPKIPVSLYGLWSAHNLPEDIDDAAETLN